MSELPRIAVDACVAMNIYATRRWSEIFAANGYRPVMALQAARETIWVLDMNGKRVTVDLTALVAARHLEIHAPVGGEVDVLVELAAHLGDGEAACLAIAQTRGFLLATDDRAAQREATRRGLVNRLRSTADLLRTWSGCEALQDADVRQVLLRVQNGARYSPPQSDPNADWWSDLAD